MRWYHYVAYFFGGIFLANCIPHLVNGVSGSPFQSPFSTPPGVGLSSSMANTAWGLFNLLVAYLLLSRVGAFEVKRPRHALMSGLGFALAAFYTAHWFARFHGGAI